MNKAENSPSPESSRMIFPPGRSFAVIIFAVLLAWIAMSLLTPGREIGSDIPYNTFKNELKVGNIERITVQGEIIRGALKAPAGRQIGDEVQQYTEFTTHLPSFGDEGRLRRRHERGGQRPPAGGKARPEHDPRMGNERKVPEHGPGTEHHNVFLGEELTRGRDYSEATAREVDEDVRGILAEAYDAAMKVLKEHRESMDRLVEELLQKEDLPGKRVLEVLGLSPEELAKKECEIVQEKEI